MAHNIDSMSFASNGKTISITMSVKIGVNTIVLNGSASYDPEGQTLRYVWWDNGAKIPNGDGIVYTYPVTPGSSHSLQLHVFDPGGLEGFSATQTVNVPGG